MTFTNKVFAAGLVVALLGGGAAVSQAQSKKYTITTVVKIAGVAWFNRMEQGVKQFAQETGQNATQVGPASADAALQNQIVEDLIAKKVDAITVVPNSPESMEPVLKKALDNKIVVIGHEGSNLENVTYDVEAFDNAAFGEHLMDNLAKAMGEEGEYAVFVGHLTAKTHNQWVDAAIARQKAKYPKMKLVADKQESLEDQQVAYTKTKELLQAHPNLKGIEGSASTDVAGAALAVEDAGLGAQVSVVGTSLPSIAGPYITSGTIKAISFWDPAKAAIAVDKVAVMALEGKKVTDGADLGVEGYNKVTLKGHVLTGQAWVDCTKDNLTSFNF
jgi:simple sugar transport system substrate-binding protein